ncbi:MAG TPA: hypothetical protein VKV74_14505 [Bryobacteraceae bacterium]|nr:hypothetical protein [Bryobacteraceae bacterium]
MSEEQSQPHKIRAPISWPRGRRFAFTVFDDPDGQSLETSRLVYGFLADLGFRTTIAVWPLAPRREPNSGGETCANPQYADYLKELASQNFEIGWHGATLHTSPRAETLEGLDRFRDLFGTDPSSMANHYNGEAIYWGPARLTGLRRCAYRALTPLRSASRHSGHVEGHPCFWGDLCRERIRYCRNFVFSDLNTLRACPWMPYHDRVRPWVNYWFAASEGAKGPSFIRAISEANQDRLEAEGGACILYTHFGHGFVVDGKLRPEFCRLMHRLSRKNGWFVPTSEMLDFLAAQRPAVTLDDRMRSWLEWRWLGEKIFRGTS